MPEQAKSLVNVAQSNTAKCLVRMMFGEVNHQLIQGHVYWRDSAQLGTKLGVRIPEKGGPNKDCSMECAGDPGQLLMPSLPNPVLSLGSGLVLELWAMCCFFSCCFVNCFFNMDHCSWSGLGRNGMGCCANRSGDFLPCERKKEGARLWSGRQG